MAITINASNRLLLLVEIKEILLMKMAVLFLILRVRLKINYILNLGKAT